MLSDEERKAIKEVKHFNQLTRYWQEEEYEEKEIAEYITTILNLIEKQSKEIERINEILTWKQKHEEQLQKEIEKLKQNIHLKEVYVLKTNDYIKGTNIEDELCNKKWEDKIKAKIEELEIEQESNREDLKIAINNLLFQNIDKIADKISINMSVRKILQSLLEKE